MSPVGRRDHVKRRINEEKVSIESLTHVLRTCCGCEDVRCHREEDDPPDFTVAIDGERFPAEVTAIAPHQEYYAQCDQLAKAIQGLASSRGSLAGTHAVVISGHPRIPKANWKRGRQLIAHALAYVDATRRKGRSASVQLAEDGRGKVRIEKVSANGSAVDILHNLPAMWEGEMRSQLAKIIELAVHRKMRRLQRAGLDPQTALLLLYDAFGYADPQDAIIALRQGSAYQWFHSIFWAASFTERRNTAYPEEPGRHGVFLFSYNPGWNCVGTVPLSIGT